MLQADLLLDFALVVAAALACGTLARILRQPTVLGYVVAGVVIGPHVPGPIPDVMHVELLAQFGIAFLLFGLGTQVNLNQLRRVQGAALLGAALQVSIMVGVALGIAFIFHLPMLLAGLFGVIVSQSSSAVIVKVLADRREHDSLHGRFAFGVSVGQDLLSIPLIVILPAISDPSGRVGTALLGGVAKAVAITALAYVVGTRLLPRVLERVAGLGRELFLLAAITLTLGAALLMQAAGLSYALGAFLAGLAIGESHMNRQVLAELVPVRELFATFFFVSVGMLFDPRFVAEHPTQVLWVLAGVMGGKALVGTIIPLVMRYPARAAVLAGLALAQIGEFAFLVAQIGVDEGLIEGSAYSLVLAGAVISIVLNPLLMAVGDGVFRVLPRLPFLGWLGGDRAGPALPRELLRDHVVLLGHNAVSQWVADELAASKVPYVVVEMDPWKVATLRRAGMQAVAGDPVNPVVLAQAGIRQAKAVAVMIADGPTADAVARHVHRLNPQAMLVVRGPGSSQLRNAPANAHIEVVSPDFELGQEYLRRLLDGYGYTSTDVDIVLGGRREAVTAR